MPLPFAFFRRGLTQPHGVYGSPVARHDEQFRALLDGGPGPKIHLRRAWWLVLFGATIGAALDYLHTHGDEIVYPEGTNHWRGVLTFAFVYSAGPMTFMALFGSEYKHHVPAPYSRSLPAMGLWCVMYALTAYGDCHSYITAAVLGAVTLYHWRTIDVGTVRSLANAFVAGAMCASVEAVLAGVLGTMSYVTQDIAGVPVWLPMLYASSIMSVVQVARRVLYVEPPLHLWDAPILKVATASESDSPSYSKCSRDVEASRLGLRFEALDVALCPGLSFS